MWAMIGRIEGLGILCLEAKLRLFKTVVGSIGNYACQVWAVDYLRVDCEEHVFANPFQQVVLTFLRTVSGVRKTTSRWVLLNEFGLLPVQSHWGVLCARFWNKSIRSRQTLGEVVLKADIILFKNGCTSCWTYKFLKCMVDLGLTNGRGISSLIQTSTDEVLLLEFEENTVLTAFARRYKTFVPDRNDDPRTAVSAGVTYVKHEAWFLDQERRHLRFSAPEHYIRTLLQFRMSNTDLRVHDWHIPLRRNRTCRFCTLGGLEDEMHVIFECPAYANLRQDIVWRQLFAMAEGCLKTFMNLEPQYEVARFVVTLLRQRKSLRGPVIGHVDMFNSDSDSEP
jgi:hypothetical protein